MGFISAPARRVSTWIAARPSPLTETRWKRMVGPWWDRCRARDRACASGVPAAAPRVAARRSSSSSRSPCRCDDAAERTTWGRSTPVVARPHRSVRSLRVNPISVAYSGACLHFVTDVANSAIRGPPRVISSSILQPGQHSRPPAPDHFPEFSPRELLAVPPHRAYKKKRVGNTGKEGIRPASSISFT